MASASTGSLGGELGACRKALAVSPGAAREHIGAASSVGGCVAGVQAANVILTNVVEGKTGWVRRARGSEVRATGNAFSRVPLASSVGSPEAAIVQRGVAVWILSARALWAAAASSHEAVACIAVLHWLVVAAEAALPRAPSTVRHGVLLARGWVRLELASGEAVRPVHDAVVGVAISRWLTVAAEVAHAVRIGAPTNAEAASAGSVEHITPSNAAVARGGTVIQRAKGFGDAGAAFAAEVLRWDPLAGSTVVRPHQPTLQGGDCHVAGVDAVPTEGGNSASL